MGQQPIRTFRDLIAWQRGMDLARLVYRWSFSLPDVERYGLISQIRRAAASVPLNIAEGYGLGTPDQFVKHLRYTRGSLFELDSALELAADVHQSTLPADLQDLLRETDRLVQGLLRSIENNR